MSPPFFIVGCPRSGTSLLRNLLRSHPNLTVPPESHFIPRCFRLCGDPAEGRDLRRVTRLILRTIWVKDWKIKVTPEELEDCRSYRDVVSRLFAAYAQKEGKPRWGDKTPHYLAELPTLLRVFPEAKIIHIIRDGRDVARSWLRTPFHPRNYYVAAQDWKRRVTRGIRDGRSLPDGSYCEVRYEDLLQDPAAAMRRVCDFLEEPFVEAVLRPNPTPQSGRWGVRMHVSRSELVTGNHGKWRSNLSPRQRALFESVAGDLLASLGYELEGLSRPVPAWERVFWHAHQRATSALVGLRNARSLPERLDTRLLLRLAEARTRLRG